jgi:hypothetical protein
MSENLSESYADAPLLELLSRPLHRLSHDELQSTVQELQEASANAQTVKTRVNKKSAKKKSNKPSASDIADQLLKS